MLYSSTKRPEGELMHTKRQDRIDVRGWTRLAEVDAYATRKRMDRATAINALVNSALSHGLDQR